MTNELIVNELKRIAEDHGGIVTHLAVFYRHIHVQTQKYALAFEHIGTRLRDRRIFEIIFFHKDN